MEDQRCVHARAQNHIQITLPLWAVALVILINVDYLTARRPFILHFWSCVPTQPLADEWRKQSSLSLSRSFPTP